MNGQRLIGMIGRMLMNRLVHRGVNYGLDRTLGSEKPVSDMSEQERAQHKRMRRTAGRAKQMTKMARRMGRF